MPTIRGIHFMLYIRTTLSTILILCITLLHATEPKQFNAVRTTDDISIDGQLTEAGWSTAGIANQFIQYEPDVGMPSSEKTVVRVLYDDSGLYIGATLYDSEPDKILRQYSQRDQIDNVDWFGVLIDPYQSGIYAFNFSVTAVGGQVDKLVNNGVEDVRWDAVWESKTSITSEGWVVEMKIPWSAIRFSEENHDWNIQFVREVRRHRETSYWSEVDPNIEGIINQSGVIRGIREVSSPRRIFFYPYVSTTQRFENAPLQPSTSETDVNFGMDLKFGINEAFTVDMTLLPDFSQTRSDDQVLNLSPFEVYYEENRPFFTEGLELFNKSGLFYTRRVGNRPVNYSSVYDALEPGEIVRENPNQTKLVNATKLSGRTSGGLGIGVFNAVTGRTTATVYNEEEATTREITTNPVANYNIIVLDQNLKNNSSISLTNTNVLRAGEFSDANVTGLTWNLYTPKQIFGITGKGVISHKTEVPDGTGHSFFIEAGKFNGSWRSTLYYNEDSDTYDINDLGFLEANNSRLLGTTISYLNTSPSNDKLNRYNHTLDVSANALYAPDTYTALDITTTSFWLLKNRWGLRVGTSLNPDGRKDFFEPRSDYNRYLPVPGSAGFNFYGSSDYRKPFAIDFDLSVLSFFGESRNEYSILIEPRYRFNDKLTVAGNLRFNPRYGDQGYIAHQVLSISDEFVENDWVLMGTRDRILVENGLTLTYIFNENMYIDFRGRLYWDRVDYNLLETLNRASELSPLDYQLTATEENRINNTTSFFNIDFFYRWRFAPGSDLIFNWKNALNHRFNNDLAYFSSIGELTDGFRGNQLSIQLIYFLDYNSLKI